MRTEIKKLRRKVRTTTVYVTHDKVEALTLADRVVVMNGGNIEQVGTPHELYHAPKTRFVAAFIGSPTMNFMPVAIERRGDGLKAVIDGGLEFDLPESRKDRYGPLAGRKDLEFGLRPEHIADARGDLAPGFAAFETTVDVTEPMGSEILVYFNVGEAQLCGKTNFDAGMEDGQPVRLVADLNHMHIVDSQSGLVI
jgi:multiple sugar transport system ATP-binding protein